MEGNLFLSLIVKSVEKSKWSWIPLCTAVSIAGCLKRIYPEIHLSIKWPNDIWIQGAKLGGILCEAASKAQLNFVIVGVGINCSHTPTGLEQAATDLTTARGGVLTLADEIRDSIRCALIEGYETLIHSGTETILKNYEQLAAFPKGTEICWGASPSYGIVEGLGPSSELRVKTLNQTISLFAEDVQKVRLLRE
jgi:BirA family biotin operon repressor/biotin-[acetyl-CoA-carboxylase] ligase